MTRSIAALFCFTVLAAPGAAWAADAAHGARLAERWCAACHVVSPSQQHGTTQAPPFSEIAKQAHIDAPMVALFLLLPHPKMPDMNLTRNEAGDLAAYIKSQAK
jgi:mono/diheme cytochrome c family protein